jgi:hypothetical protein
VLASSATNYEGEIMNLFWGYVVIAGTVAAVAKIARGAVQAIHKAAEGERTEGLGKLGGGLVAPALEAGRELWSLGAEAVEAAQVMRGKMKKRIGRTRISNCAGEAKA